MGIPRLLYCTARLSHCTARLSHCTTGLRLMHCTILIAGLHLESSSRGGDMGSLEM